VVAFSGALGTESLWAASASQRFPLRRGHRPTIPADAEKVRSQFLSLRQCSGRLIGSPDFQYRNRPTNRAICLRSTVPESCDQPRFTVGDGIFLRSFVVRHFSIVQKTVVREQLTTAKVSSGLNLFRKSERNAETESGRICEKGPALLPGLSYMSVCGN